MSTEYKNRLPITAWSLSDRPREKYIAQGSQALSNTELIAILLRNGTKDQSAVDIAKRLLASTNNNINRLADLSVSELMKIKGIGQVKAITLHAAFEIGRRRRAEVVEVKKKINCSEDVLELMQTKIAELSHEEFWTIFVNNNSTFLDMKKIGEGGWTATIVDVRMIISRAIEKHATGIIICHNHPSGRLTPSDADICLTDQIQQATSLMNIQLIDHLIIHKDNYYSFYAEGLL
ncbi:MAG: DNA repair protein RadC [Bacteroidales bacterium]|jgi:DNA repair protein RadC|nr:DNA repair protein RadC [Bacteroidales bacterium]